MEISLCDHILLIFFNKYLIRLKTDKQTENPDASSNGIVVLFLVIDH